MPQQQQSLKQQQVEASSQLLPSCRALTALVVFLGTFILYILRINMSVVIVCMTLPTNATGAAANGSAERMEADYEWSRDIQGKILSSFYIGYLLMQIPAGVLAQRFAPKHVISVLTCLAAISTLLVPPAAAISWKLVFALRVVTGLGSSVIFPGLHQLWSQWAPPLERSKLVGFSYSGAPIGVIAGMLLSAYLCSTTGWQFVFYLYGCLGLVWVAAWSLLVYNSPDEHPFVSEAEKNYISHELNGQIGTDEIQQQLKPNPVQHNTNSSSTAAQQPDAAVSVKQKLKGLCSGEQQSTAQLVMQLVRSKPFWAIIVANVAFDWAGYTFTTCLPTFLKDSFKLSLTDNGILSCLPYIGFFVVELIASYVADWLQERGCLSTKNTRRLMTFLSMLLPAMLISSIFLINSTARWVPILLLIAGISFNGCAFGGMLVNHVDIAPRFAGVLFAISNTAGAMSGVVAPYIASLITKDGTAGQWRIVFLIAAAVLAAGSLFYSVFAEATVQDWASGVDQTEISCQAAHPASTAPDPDDTVALV